MTQKHFILSYEKKCALLSSEKFQSWRPERKTKKSDSANRGVGSGKAFDYAGTNFENLGDSDKHVIETHYSPAQVAEIWGLDVDTVRSLFEDEPNVLIVNRPGTRHKRRYRTFKIPESVMVRVHNRLSSRG
jgi:hypothetical protein